MDAYAFEDLLDTRSRVLGEADSMVVCSLFLDFFFSLFFLFLRFVHKQYLLVWRRDDAVLRFPKDGRSGEKWTEDGDPQG